ncbi:unnamed protein product [Owenia fusiformis]|uniref:Fidgetin-like protein 1 n=1 Tax=Owenia fusiformis TaxID=6347 RepID=A0A8J1UPE7_OWEFU|nr:unnamed protein product [Owenia fusiformis]
MESKPTDTSDHLAHHNWQSALFQQQSQETTPSDKADILRDTFCQLQLARANKLLSPEACSVLFNSYTEAYTSIIDSPSDQGGVDNYAEAALAISKGHKNESDKWKSGLSLDKIKNLQNFKNLLDTSKFAHSNLCPDTIKSTLMKPCKVTQKTSQSTFTSQTARSTANINEQPVSGTTSNSATHRIGTSENNGQSSDNKTHGSFSKSLKNQSEFGFTTASNLLHSDKGQEIPNQGQGLSNQGQGFPNQGQGFPNQGKEFQNQGQGFQNQGQGFQNQGQGFPNRGQGIINQRQRFPSEGQIFQNQVQQFSKQAHDSNNAGKKLFRHPRNSPTMQSGGSPVYQPPGEMPSGGLKRKQGSFGGTTPSLYSNACTKPTSNNPGNRSRDYGTARNNNGTFRENNGSSRYNNGFTKDNGATFEEEDQKPSYGHFKTAGEQLAIDQQKKFGRHYNPSGSITTSSYGTSKKSLGTRRGPSNKFVPPVLNRDADTDNGGVLVRKAGPNKDPQNDNEPVDERLKNIDPKMIELIQNEIMDHGPPISWDDIAGLQYAKDTIKEIVVWPMLRPDIFTGLRGPPKGLLLFGPPGTGKTLIGKCVASQSKSTFFSISASSLTSKWVGEGEKMVRAMFAVARCHQPAVIFIDEIDSLLSQRSDGEHEASRRIKTEFLVQLDGAATGSEDRILVIGATNRPREIDEAARRRFVKRLYIPLPEVEARKQIVVNLLSKQGAYELLDDQLDVICTKSAGYSGADMANLCREAALGPIRSISMENIEHITTDQVRPISYKDFQDALNHVKASVSQQDLDSYIDWNNLYGSGGK